MSKVKNDGKAADAELVRCVQGGSAAAFNELVARHTAKAYQIAYGILGSREDAEEVAQDAFVKVYHGIGQFRGDADFSTWLYRITVNLAKNKYNWRRRRGHEESVSIHGPADTADGIPADMPLPDTSAGAETVITGEELRIAVEKAMEKLPAKFREVLTLRHVQDLPYDKIAEVVGCNVGTVKSRLARAREALRKMVGR